MASVDIWSSGIYSKVIIVDKNGVSEVFDILDEEIEAIANALNMECGQACESQPPKNDPGLQATTA